MTLWKMPRYDRTRPPERGDHAVVIGASMAGLLAGRVLADAFDRVTIVERDPLPDGAVARRGVPQANHVHVMLEPGRAILEDLFPRYCDELREEGGLRIDAATDLDYFQRGDFLAESEEPVPFYCASRPLFEGVARRRTADYDAVALRGGCQFTGYVSDADATAVRGVRIRNENGDEEELAADLVVDATGRTSRTPRWLERNGYPAPDVEEVSVDLGYGTVAVERPPDDRRGYLVVPSAPATRAGTAIPVEGDRWIVTLSGLHGDHPPTDEDGFAEFAASLPVPAIARLLDEHERADDEIHAYPFPSSKRRYYEDLDRFPDGLLVTGDAVASFNPIYGQGMSVAALDALALHHALAGTEDRDLADRFFDRVAETVDVVWRIAVGADFDFEATEGPKPRGTDLFNRYLAGVVRCAHTDARVSEQFTRVLRLEEPPTKLLEPEVLWRVAKSEVGRYV